MKQKRIRYNSVGIDPSKKVFSADRETSVKHYLKENTKIHWMASGCLKNSQTLFIAYYAFLSVAVLPPVCLTAGYGITATLWRVWASRTRIAGGLYFARFRFSVEKLQRTQLGLSDPYEKRSISTAKCRFRCSF